MYNQVTVTEAHELILGAKEFDFFRSKIFELAGINLSEAKVLLVQSRLRKRVLSLGLKSFKAYADYLQVLPRKHLEWGNFTNLLTTNKTQWFRDISHFDFIESQFLPNWKKLGRKHLKVWCAACSTGEEAYSLSFILARALKNSDVTYSIHASDIDTQVLQIARNGVYPRTHLEKIHTDFYANFSYGTKDIANWIKVKNEFKTPILFHQKNLLDSQDSSYSDHDLVFCRNVLIYFNRQTVKDVVNNIYQAASRDACLIIAHTESLQNIKTNWRYHCPSIFYKGNLLIDN